MRDLGHTDVNWSDDTHLSRFFPKAFSNLLLSEMLIFYKYYYQNMHNYLCYILSMPQYTTTITAIFCLFLSSYRCLLLITLPLLPFSSLEPTFQES